MVGVYMVVSVGEEWGGAATAKSGSDDNTYGYVATLQVQFVRQWAKFHLASSSLHNRNRFRQSRSSARTSEGKASNKASKPGANIGNFPIWCLNHKLHRDTSELNKIKNSRQRFPMLTSDIVSLIPTLHTWATIARIWWTLKGCQIRIPVRPNLSSKV